MRQGDLFEQSLPYAGTSGATRTDTSIGRVSKRDSDGTTGRDQRFALRLLQRSAEYGVTVVDLREHVDFKGHHGDASSVLTTLHKDDRIVRLVARRDRSHVYVLPAFVNDRETLPFRSQCSFLPIDSRSARRAAVDYIRAKRGSADEGEQALAAYLRAALEVPR